MVHFKKAAAFSASLLICLSTAAYPLMGSFAENEENTTVTSEESSADTEDDAVVTTADTDDDEDEPKEEQDSTGVFIYNRDGNGNAHIVRSTASGKELVVPEEIDGCKVVELKSEAFVRVVVERIVLPASLETIASDNPFVRCDELKEIVVDEKNENFCTVDGVLYTKDMKKLVCCPASKSGSSLTIPEGVETIGVAAVYGTGFSEIKLPSTLKTLERHCFGYNEKLKSVDMSGTNIENIGVMAFVDCAAVENVICSDSTTEIGLGAFMNCEKLSEVTLSRNLAVIGQSAFQGTNILRVRIPDSVNSIGYNAFGYDKDERTIKDFVIIGSRGSAAQTYATDKDSDYGYSNSFTFLTTDEADLQEELADLDIKEHGYYEYAVEDGNATIISCVTMNETVEVPEEMDGYKVTKIFRNAFAGSGCKKLILPDSVEYIGKKAFSSSLESLTIPGGCKEINGMDQFLLCTSLKEINVTDGDGAFASIDGVLYSKDCTFLIAYPAGKEDEKFKAPKTLDDINDCGFCFNQHIKEADLSNVIYIGSEAFEGCESLSFVKFSKNLKYVGDNAFLGCISLKKVHLYDKIEDLGDYSFGYQYDETLAQQLAESEEGGHPYSVISDFIIYTDEDSLAHKYAKACGITVVTGRVQVGKTELSNSFIYVFGGIGAAVVLGLGAALVDKMLFKKKRDTKKESAE